MAQTQTNTAKNAREASLARRRALSQSGKAALGSKTSPAPATASRPAKTATAAVAARSGGDARSASRARRQAMSQQGKAGVSSQDRTRAMETRQSRATPASAANPADSSCGCGCKDRKADTSVATAAPAVKPVTPTVGKKRIATTVSAGRAASVARRQAMSTRGKAGISRQGMTAAQTARAMNPQMSGRELAQALREQRSKNGNSSKKKSEPCGRIRPGKQVAAGAAQDAPWKVGASETTHGQTVTGTMVGRSVMVTGDEPSTCRTVTGTEYMGADIFRAFCQSEAGSGPRKIGVSPTSRGNRITGNEVGRSERVTGDEPGSCKRVTGNEYVGAQQMKAFCGTEAEPGPGKFSIAETQKGKKVTGNNVGRSNKVTGDEPGSGRALTGTQYMQSQDSKSPAKVGISKTLRGGSVTGTMTGRSERVTGDEPGSCKNITGDDYIGEEQYSGFCARTPAPSDRKVGVSQTVKGKGVTGTMTGRSERVTGDEPGTCKTVTGTPYAGAEQYDQYCETGESTLARARGQHRSSTAASTMTGLQPGIGGKMTGDKKGACEPVTGTPYVGADQFANACPAVAAEPGSPDFPQALGETPWGQFSVDGPSHAVAGQGNPNVTGSRYEQGHITGPFGMATGKVTGTEEFRFGQANVNAQMQAPVVQEAETIDGRLKSRITGEGMDAGVRVTGDDWDRGDAVTGTEGRSAVRRNPTRRGVNTAMAMMQQPEKRNEDMVAPTSKVTGGSGNTERGALVTYSGGARG